MMSMPPSRPRRSHTRNRGPPGRGLRAAANIHIAVIATLAIY
jgi:hypothetical protein